MQLYADFRTENFLFLPLKTVEILRKMKFSFPTFESYRNIEENEIF